MKTIRTHPFCWLFVSAICLMPFVSLSQTAGTGDSYCETLNNVIKLYREGKYKALCKAGTEKKADIASLYDLEYEAANPLTPLFEKSFILKETDLTPVVYSVRYFNKSNKEDNAAGIYDQLKGCFSGWEFSEESESYEETDDLITDIVYFWTFTYIKEGVKVRFYIEEATGYNQIELKIDKN